MDQVEYDTLMSEFDDLFEEMEEYRIVVVVPRKFTWPWQKPYKVASVIEAESWWEVDKIREGIGEGRHQVFVELNCPIHGWTQPDHEGECDKCFWEEWAEDETIAAYGLSERATQPPYEEYEYDEYEDYDGQRE